MMWGGISYKVRIELIFINGDALTASRYIEEFLIEHMVPYTPRIGEEFLLMLHNDRPHAARILD